MKFGIIFDLDGTLLDTMEDLVDAVNHTLTHFRYPERDPEEIRRFVGNGARWLVRQAVPEGADPEEAFRYYQEFYHAHSRIKTKPYSGIPEALAALREKYPIAIVSNKPDTAVKPLCDHYFPDVYALGECPDIPRKPAPDMVKRTMAELGMECCVYVGDSEVDILTAQNAGVPCLSVLWGFRSRAELEAAGGSHFCETTAELTKKLEEIIHGK